MQSCQVDEYVYLPDAGYVTPARALEAETPFEGNVEVGMNEVDGSADLTVVEISATDGGYLATGVASCETTTAYGADAATAHPAGDYYDNANNNALDLWPGGGQPNVAVRWTSNVPSAARTAIRAGFETWNDDTNTETFSVGAEQPNSPVDFSCPISTQNEVHWNEDLGGTKAGRVTFCINGQSEITTFAMAFDSVNYTWCTAVVCTGLPGLDLRGYATHEFGHVTGWDGHFPTSECTGPTMCPSPGDGSGFEWRSLSFHDIHTAENAYD